MTDIDSLLAANKAYAAGDGARVADARPGKQMAVVTCMDARIDVLPALGLHLGDAHVIRNAGGRVTDDVLRSLALSTHVLGVETVVVMQHTRCGLSGATEDALRERTGADIRFLVIPDHTLALEEDIALLTAQPYLQRVTAVVGLLYDVETAEISDVVRWERGA